MAEFCALWPDGPLFAQASHFRLGTDCVLLSDFTAIGGAKRGIDLGCASGAIMLLLLSRSERLHMTGLELLPEAAALARENMAVNALEARSDVVTGDIRRFRERFVDRDCADLLKRKDLMPTGQSRDLGVADHCGILIVSAVEILCDYIAELKGE